MAGDRETCGRLLRRFRQRARLSQEDLAERSGYSASYLSKLERDERQPPLVALDRLAGILGLESRDREALRAAREHQSPVPLSPRPGLAPVAGRSRELAQIDRFLAGREPPVLLLTGEPGIGKTRLLEEAAARADARGWHVIQGGCQRRAQDPYAPLADALARSIQQLSEREQTASLDGAARLDLLLPELAAGETSPSSPSGRSTDAGGWGAIQVPAAQQRRLLVAAVIRYLRQHAGPAGTLLVLDDLQWAGTDALEVLAALATSSGAGKSTIRLIGAYRDSEAAPASPLGGLVADLARAGLVRLLPLGTLSDEEARQLLADLMPDDPEDAEGDEMVRALLPAIARRAGGVPFFLLSYAEDVRLLAADDEPHNLELPWNVTQVIRQRVVALPPPVQELLGIAAMIGRVVPRALLLRVAGVTEEVALAGLEAASEARLLDEDGARSYRFTHDLIRETIERDLSAGRRQLLHRRIGEAQEHKVPLSLDMLAYHFARSDDEARAVRYLELAGDEAQQRVAHAAAADFFREALARLVPAGRLIEAAPLQEKLGLALFVQGQYDEAIAVLERALATYQAQGDEEAIDRTAGRLAEVHFRRGSGEEVVDHFTSLATLAPMAGDGAAALSSSGSRGALDLREGVFRLLFATGAYRQMAAAGQALTRVGRATRNSRLAAMGERAQGIGLIFLGRLAEGIALLEQELPEELATGVRARVADTTTVLVGAHLAMGAVQRSAALSRQMLALAQSLDDRAIMACYLVLLGVALHVAGNWEEARANLRQADDLFASVPPSALSIGALPLRAVPLIWEGEWEAARRYLERVAEQARAMHAVLAQRQAVTRLAELDVLAGHPAAALARLQPLAGADPVFNYIVPLLSTLAEAYLEVGEVERAAALAQQAVAEADRTGTRFFSVAALRMKGRVDARQDLLDQALESFEEGLRRARDIPFPYGEAQVLEAYARFEREQGDLESSRRRLQEALTIFERLGARRDVERLRAALHGSVASTGDGLRAAAPAPRSRSPSTRRALE